MNVSVPEEGFVKVGLVVDFVCCPAIRLGMLPFVAYILDLCSIWDFTARFLRGAGALSDESTRSWVAGGVCLGCGSWAVE